MFFVDKMRVLLYDMGQIYEGIIMGNDLKMIKKKYGEEMMKLCRSLFSTILENDGELFTLIILGSI